MRLLSIFKKLKRLKKSKNIIFFFFFFFLGGGSSDKMSFHLENMPSKNLKCLFHFISQLKNMKYIFQPKKYLHSNFKRSKKHLPQKTLHSRGLKNVWSLDSFISFVGLCNYKCKQVCHDVYKNMFIFSSGKMIIVINV